MAWNIPTRDSTDNLSKVRSEVENARKRLQWIGQGDLATPQESGSVLNKLFNVLQGSYYGSSNALREVLSPQSGSTPDRFDPLSAFIRGAREEEKVTGRDIATELGMSREPMFDVGTKNFRFSPSPAGMAGFAMDIFNPADPLNWLTFGLGRAGQTAGKKGYELLSQAFGDVPARQIIGRIGTRANELSARNVGDLAERVLREAKDPAIEKELADIIYGGMKELGVDTQTGIPGISSGKSIVTRIQSPILGKTVGQVTIPGSNRLVGAVTRLGEGISKTGMGDTLGRRFSTSFVPTTARGNVLYKMLGKTEPGEKQYLSPVEKMLGEYGYESGSEAYKGIIKDLQKSAEKFRKTEDLYRDDIRKIFEGITIQERKKIMDYLAKGVSLDKVPKKLRVPMEAFIKERDSIIKEYRGMGVNIKELENYVPFIITGGRLTKAEAKLLESKFGTNKVKPMDKSDAITSIASRFDPHVKERRYSGATPKEINDLLGREWLTEDAALALSMRGSRFIRTKEVITFLEGMLQKYGITVGDMSKLKEVSELPETLSKKELIKQLQEYKIIDPNILTTVKGGLPENYGLFKVKSTQSGGVKIEPVKEATRETFALPEDFANVFNEYMDMFFPKTQDSFTRLFDSATSGFRTVAYLWNVGHIMRDLTSNMFNAWLGGVKSLKPYIQSLDLIKPFEKGGMEGRSNLTVFIPSEGRMVTGEELYDTARNQGVVDTGQALGETPQSIQASLGGRKWTEPKKYTEAFTGMMIDWTRRVDNYTRMAMFLDGLQKGMNVSEAAIHTKKFLFDYFDLTPFERQWMRRIIPFYTWLRKNLPLQLEQFVKQPGKYETVVKYHEAISEGEKDMPSYLEESEALRLPGGTHILPNLPYADLARIPYSVESMRELMSNINPLIRVLPEIAVGTEFFSGLPLEYYRGERSEVPVLENMFENYTGREVPERVPKRTVGHIINQIPFLRNLDTMVNPEDPRSLNKSLSFLGFPPTYPEESVEKAFTYEERDRLRDLIRYLKDQGMAVPGIRDIPY